MSDRKLYSLSEREAAVLRARAPRWTDSAQRATPDPLTPINTDAAVERMARVFADLEPGEPWPTNEELGGGPTGSRDDEFWHDCMDRARAALEALLGSEQGGAT